MIGADGLINYANADAEDFFRSSAAMLARATLARFVPFGSPMLTLVDQVRERQAPVNEYRVDISSPRIGIEKIVDIYVAPVPRTARLRRRDVSGAVDGRQDRPPDDASRRGALGHRPRGDAGARDQEPAVRHPRRGAVAGDGAVATRTAR